MKRTIYTYHGKLPLELETILDKIASRVNGTPLAQTHWNYTGTLDDFAAAWGKHIFAVYYPDLIFVTQHSSFNAR